MWIIVNCVHGTRNFEMVFESVRKNWMEVSFFIDHHVYVCRSRNTFLFIETENEFYFATDFIHKSFDECPMKCWAIWIPCDFSVRLFEWLRLHRINHKKNNQNLNVWHEIHFIVNINPFPTSGSAVF